MLEIRGFSSEEKYLDSKLEELKILAILFLPAEDRAPGFVHAT